MNWSQVVDRVLAWLKKNAPGLLLAFGVGKKVGENGLNEAVMKSEKLEVENEKLKNQIENNLQFDGKSDADVIADALKGSDDKP